MAYNLRNLRRRERRAMRVLIFKHGFQSDAFKRADGTETLDAPSGLKRASVECGQFFSPSKNTPLYWQQTNYEYNEWEPYLPSDLLALVETDWAAMAAEFAKDLERIGRAAFLAWEQQPGFRVVKVAQPQGTPPDDAKEGDVR